MPKRCQLNQERGIEKREHREKISLNERTQSLVKTQFC